jgi:hypothetical protein
MVLAMVRMTMLSRISVTLSCRKTYPVGLASCQQGNSFDISSITA